MNPSTAFATVLADELVRCGLREAVLAPGSRSAPLAMALYDLAGPGRPGRGKRGVVPPGQRCGCTCGSTSGRRRSSPSGWPRRAAGRWPSSARRARRRRIFHAAVIEADESGVPLLVLTADRPPELRGTGANQTIDQLKLYGERRPLVLRGRRAGGPARAGRLLAVAGVPGLGAGAPARAADFPVPCT